MLKKGRKERNNEGRKEGEKQVTSNMCDSLVWWHVSRIPEPERLRQQHGEFKGRLGLHSQTLSRDSEEATRLCG